MDSRINGVMKLDEVAHEMDFHNEMHDNPNYTRLKHPETGEEIGQLGYQCGSHCGVITTGKHSHVGHCPCVKCHDGKQT